MTISSIILAAADDYGFVLEVGFWLDRTGRGTYITHPIGGGDFNRTEKLIAEGKLVEIDRHDRELSCGGRVTNIRYLTPARAAQLSQAEPLICAFNKAAAKEIADRWQAAGHKA